MDKLTNTQFLTFVLEVLQSHGCSLADIDFEKKVIRLEGSEKAKVTCALALQAILGVKNDGGKYVHPNSHICR